MTTKQPQAIKPTFCLRGVDPRQVEQSYKSGSFGEIKIPESRILINKDIPSMAPTYGKSFRDGIYSLKHKIGQGVVVATSNHQRFKHFMDTEGEVKMGGRCWWCRCDFTGESCGSVVQQANIIDEETGTTIYVFWTYGTMCDDACVLAYDKDMAKRMPDKRDPTTQGSESGLRFLHSLKYPEAGMLEEADDWKLLEINGGSLTVEQYRPKRYTYHRVGGILVIPAKTSYLQKNY